MDELKNISNLTNKLERLFKQKAQSVRKGKYYTAYYLMIDNYLLELTMSHKNITLYIYDLLNKRFISSIKDFLILFGIGQKNAIKILELVIKAIEENNSNYINEIFNKYNILVRKLFDFEIERKIRAINNEELKAKIRLYLI